MGRGDMGCQKHGGYKIETILTRSLLSGSTAGNEGRRSQREGLGDASFLLPALLPSIDSYDGLLYCPALLSVGTRHCTLQHAKAPPRSPRRWPTYSERTPVNHVTSQVVEILIGARANVDTREATAADNTEIAVPPESVTAIPVLRNQHIKP